MPGGSSSSTLERILNRLVSPVEERRRTRDLFLSLLGVVSFLAFLSHYNQIHGLVGEEGILPVFRRLELAYSRSGFRALLDFPTLAWMGSGGGTLTVLCGAGMLCAVVLVLNVFPGFLLLLSWLFYLSLTVAGQVFTGDAWDNLFLETLFCSMTLVSFTGCLGGARRGPSRLSLLLMKVLLFKVMFLAGIHKLLSGQSAWRNLEAVGLFLENQPFPTHVAWYLYQLPDGVLAAATLVVLFGELVLPFLLFSTRRLRITTAYGLGLFQVVLLVVGNFGVLNVMIMVLCFLQLDDTHLNFLVGNSTPRMPGSRSYGGGNGPQLLLATVLFLGNLMLFAHLFLGGVTSGSSSRGGSLLGQFRIVNSYEFYSSLPTNRREIVVQGSRDGKNWKDYVFEVKPGPLNRLSPPILLPPRLDAKIWAAGFRSGPDRPWFKNFLVRLLQGRDAVTGLLAENPFEDRPPEWIRVVTYRYRFSSYQRLFETGEWWVRDRRRRYVPSVRLSEDGLQSRSSPDR